MSLVPARLIQRVRRRAHGCCESCRSQERIVGEEFTIDHIVPRARGGRSESANLALCCYVCNPLKSDKTEALDPRTGKVIPIFNPRRQRWSAHFEWSDDGVAIVGKTPMGRATIEAPSSTAPVSSSPGKRG